VATALAADPASPAAHLWPGSFAPTARPRGGRHRLHRVARSRAASRLALVALTGALAMLSGAAGPVTSPTGAPVTAVAEAPHP
jgi:hypothetical protein